MTGAKAYLVNTGWNGTGKRISIRDTRGIIDAILDGSIEKAPTKTIPYFDFTVPTELPGVDPKILDPRDTYANASEWDEKAQDLPDVSSRTSPNSPETKLEKLSLLPVRNSNKRFNFITEEGRFRKECPSFYSRDRTTDSRYKHRRNSKQTSASSVI